MILVYQDYVHNNGILFRNLKRLYGAKNVNFCDFRDIKDGILDNTRLLIMPGGADLYNCEKLNGVPNKKIQTFVENGGAYLGLCAGAYYASASIKWAEGTNQEIKENRELNFFDGFAIGPVSKYLENGDVNQSWKAIVPLIRADGGTIYAFYEGGCYFKINSRETARIIASYENIPDNPPAIIECEVGKGKAILSGVHIEYDKGDISARLYAHQNTSFLYDKRICENEGALDIVFFKEICDRLLK